MLKRQALTTNRRNRRRRGGIIGVILIVIVAFFCALSIATVLVVKTVKVHENGAKNVTIDTPAGSVRIQGRPGLDPAAAGIPIYPAAALLHRDKSGGASFEWTSKDGKSDRSTSISGGEYITQDSADRVVDFYRKKLDTWIFVSKNHHEFEFKQTEGGWKRIVAIHERGDGTHIGVASIGEPASN